MEITSKICVRGNGGCFASEGGTGEHASQQFRTVITTLCYHKLIFTGYCYKITGGFVYRRTIRECQRRPTVVVFYFNLFFLGLESCFQSQVFCAKKKVTLVVFSPEVSWSI